MKMTYAMQGHSLTDQILAHWKQTDAFQRSIDSRSAKMSFTFFDGPPFTSGDPHYGHLLQSVIKDLVPRYMTMRGYQVQRKRGWDCHGIPAENFVNKQLGITSKKQVEEEIGLEKYIETCRSMVNNVNDKWEWFVDHIGRRVDMDNAYFTMHNEYMESVIHLFADLYHNNLIYKGFKVLGYSRALGTPLSNHEINEGYQMRQDPAVTVKLTLTGKKNQELGGKKKGSKKSAEKNMSYGVKRSEVEVEHDSAETYAVASDSSSASSEGQYEYTEDGYLQTVMGVIKKDEKYLMIYDIKAGNRRVPGGKVDVGEDFEDAVARELSEEIGITTTQAKYGGSIKVPHGGKLVKLNYYDIEYTGEFVNNEPNVIGGIAWISKSDADNELGYAMRVQPTDGSDAMIIDDPERIENEFKDFQIISNELYATDGIADADISLLAWTTTPWTLPSNMFGAVNQDLDYALIYDLTKQECCVIAQSLIGRYYKNDSDYLHIYTLAGKNFLGLRYTPLFDYYYQDPQIDPVYHTQVHQIVHADFVTSESGTGIAHQAPAYGEDDYDLIAEILPRQSAKDRLFDPVDQHGDFTTTVSDFAGTNVIEANKAIISHLKDANLIVKVETIDHSYPHCPRTKTPLIYKAIESWFVKEDQLKSKTVPGTDDQYFVPETVKKRFVNGLASAPDWNISRTRFWGCPLPVRENPDDPKERLVVGSIEEIYQYNTSQGQIEKKGDKYYYTNTGKLVDLHRPYIDDIILVHPETGNELHRIPEVLDCWFESGSMPYGQVHWMKQESMQSQESGIMSQEITTQKSEKPHVIQSEAQGSVRSRKPLAENEHQVSSTMDSRLRRNDRSINSEGSVRTTYPTADFIAEGLDQTRGWFRALHVLANAYIDQPVYKNVVVTGMILAEDGKKMSKSLQNYPDPSGILNQYGADPLRLYLMSSPVVRGEPLRFSEQGVEQMLKDFVIPLTNVWKFLKTYAEVDDWSHDGTQLYFMRHAEATGQLESAHLTPTGKYQLEDKEFIENVLRVDPELIITSPWERAYDTALGVQSVMHDYADKKIEVLTSDLVVKPGLTSETVAQVYTEIKTLAQGKRVLIVSHQKRFRILMQYLLGLSDEVVENHDQSAPYHLSNTEIVKLLGCQIHNELDQWIVSELHAMMGELNAALQGYHIESATKVLLGFIEKLTNWYVRRSRRRFWAEGMTDDKHAAYTTLWEVLETYLKCAAPFAPFVIEKIRLEMLEHKRNRMQKQSAASQHVMGGKNRNHQLENDTVSSSGGIEGSRKSEAVNQSDDTSTTRRSAFGANSVGHSSDSIHLTYRPLQSDHLIDETLMQEVATVRKIIKGALYLRAKKQVKVKQPLQSLDFTVL